MFLFLSRPRLASDETKLPPRRVAALEGVLVGMKLRRSSLRTAEDNEKPAEEGGTLLLVISTTDAVVYQRTNPGLH